MINDILINKTKKLYIGSKEINWLLKYKILCCATITYALHSMQNPSVLYREHHVIIMFTRKEDAKLDHELLNAISGMMQSMTDTVRNDLKSDLTQLMREMAQNDLKPDLMQSVRDMAQNDLKPDLMQSVRDMVQNDLKPDLMQSVRDMVQDDLKPDLMQSVRDMAQNDLKPDLMQTVRDMVQNDLKPDLMQSMRDMVQNDLKSDLMQSMRDMVQDELKPDLLLTMSDMMDHKLQPVNDRLKRIELTQENDILPRLQNIESCYLSTFKRYQVNAGQIDALQDDVDILKKVVAEHSEKLQKLA